MGDLNAFLQRQANELGFDLVGIAAAVDADTFDRLGDWLDREYAGEMHYLGRRREAYRHPRSVLPAVRSVVMVGMNYAPAGSESADCRIARYARGRDYHDVLREKLADLLAALQAYTPCSGRSVVDTAPLLERDFARRAGLGWFGKNTMLLNKRLGSYFFLGALLLDLALQPDAPHAAAHCGTCTACLDACPTQAFTAPYVLDARRCISYLTIELRGSVPEELRPALGEWLFGCDVCQEVCPWNRKAPQGREPQLQPREELLAVDPIALLSLKDEEFRARFRDTALWRAKRSGVLRNAALVLGNRGDAAAIPALERALDDPEPLVREAAAWALERLRK